MEILGPICFGIVVGWVTYRTLRRRGGQSGLSDIATVIGAVGGGAVTALFPQQSLFNSYAIGLAIGFFGYLLVAFLLEPKKESVAVWMDDDAGASASGGRKPYE
jgi:uncharacterized membrane protein YeaQ/YmgE (transglycosylase-associated protein family)